MRSFHDPQIVQNNDLQLQNDYLARLKAQLAKSSVRIANEVLLKLYPYQQEVIEREVRELARLSMDPDISLEAKRAISRQMGEKEAARTALEGTLANLTQSAQQGAERLVAEVRKSVEEARHNFAGMNDPLVLNRFVEDFIGRITVTADGRLEQAGDPTQTAPAIAGAVVPMNVAGARYVTRSLIRAAYWATFSRAAQVERFATKSSKDAAPGRRNGGKFTIILTA